MSIAMCSSLHVFTYTILCIIMLVFWIWMFEDSCGTRFTMNIGTVPSTNVAYRIRESRNEAFNYPTPLNASNATSPFLKRTILANLINLNNEFVAHYIILLQSVMLMLTKIINWYVSKNLVLNEYFSDTSGFSELMQVLKGLLIDVYRREGADWREIYRDNREQGNLIDGYRGVYMEERIHVCKVETLVVLLAKKSLLQHQPRIAAIGLSQEGAKFNKRNMIAESMVSCI
uniref:Uncharacterized protein n=1 Tax=Glossina palpalis gambiensis TaxID=67801 RepID=A0A1B0ANC5_9MUSC